MKRKRNDDDGGGGDDNDDDDDNNNNNNNNSNDHKLQQVAEDYQPGDCLNEGMPIFILLSVQPKL